MRGQVGRGAGNGRISDCSDQKRWILSGLRRKNMMGAIIPELMHRIPSELRS